MNQPRHVRGFTLIELMVTVAIVAIITSLAYPAYTEYIKRGRRAEARGLLMESAQWMERFYTQNQRYDKNSANTAVAAAFAAYFVYSPKSLTEPGFYQLSVETPTANTFTVKATPINSMAGDKCGVYTVTHTGARGNLIGATALDAATSQSCWK